MHPKIGIIICGFNENRQFVPNVYIQSVRYAKGIPLLIPLVRSDRMIDDYVSLCDGFLFCGGEDITPLLFGEEPQNGNGKNRHYGRPFSNPSHEARSGFPKTCPCNLQRNADFKCFLRRNNLAGSFPYPTADAQPHTAVRIQRRCQPPHQNRTLLKAQTICRLVHLCEQFPPSICQNTREKRLCQRPFPGRRH